MQGTTIEDTYTITDTSTTGWNPANNTDLTTPAQSWATFSGLVVLAFLGVILGIVINSFRKMGE